MIFENCAVSKGQSLKADCSWQNRVLEPQSRLRIFCLEQINKTVSVKKHIFTEIEQQILLIFETLKTINLVIWCRDSNQKLCLIIQDIFWFKKRSNCFESRLLRFLD